MEHSPRERGSGRSVTSPLGICACVVSLSGLSSDPDTCRYVQIDLPVKQDCLHRCRRLLPRWRPSSSSSSHSPHPAAAAMAIRRRLPASGRRSRWAVCCPDQGPPRHPLPPKEQSCPRRRPRRPATRTTVAPTTAPPPPPPPSRGTSSSAAATCRATSGGTTGTSYCGPIGGP